MTSLENHEDIVEYSGERDRFTYGKEQIEWRRVKVLELSSQGYNQNDMAVKLQIAKGTVNSDLAYIRKQAAENIKKHIQEIVPEEYQKCMVGMKQNLKHVLEIGEIATDPKVKLQARAIANDCYRYIMELCTNAGIVNEALKFVTQKQAQINTLQKIDERTEATEEEETTATGAPTTNGVF